MKAVPFTLKSHNAFLLILLCFSAALHAAPPKEALLIANGKYSHFAGLAHPEPDAAKLGAALEGLGFRVRVVRDGNREEMLEAISEFERELRNTGAIAFFHYGGHGIQVDGKNYLLPADADIPDERRVATRAVALDEVMTAMDAAAARASIIVIDACRDNPLPAGSGRNLARGLSVVGLKPKNSIVIYAAEAGSKALDGLFTPILATALQQKGRTIDQVMKSVRSEVYAKSNGQQTPGEYNQLFEELVLSKSELNDQEKHPKTTETNQKIKPIAIDSLNLRENAEDREIPKNLNELAGSYAQATAYFELVLEALEKSGDKSEKFSQARDYAMAISLALASVGRKSEMAVNVTNSRIEFYKKEMLKEIGYRNENFSVLMNKYSQPSIELINNPSDLAVKALDDFTKR